MDNLKYRMGLLREALQDAEIAFQQVVLTPLHDGAKTLRERASHWLNSVQNREQITGQDLNEGSWAILMDLYVNQGVRTVSVSSACIGSGHPPTSALRWIKRLIELGLVVREVDDLDGRRAHLVLTSEAETAILAHLGN